MQHTLSDKSQIARKYHEDSAGVWIREQLDEIRTWNELSFSEWRAIARLKANGWKIVPGQRYNRATMVDEGEFYEFKYLPEIHEICRKYDLYVYD